MSIGRAALWARMPPPPGGVTRANMALQRSLAEHFHVSVVDGSAVDIASLFKGRIRGASIHLQVCSMSRPSRILSIAPMIRLLGGHLLVILHGAAYTYEMLESNSFKARLTRRLLRFRAEVWVNNADVAERLAAVGIRAEVVSPCRSVSSASAGRQSFEGGYRILVAEGNNDPLYNADAVLSLGSRLQAAGTRVEVVLLNYGPHAKPRTVPAYVRQVMNADDNAVLEALNWANLFIRPTTTDGDSMLVREALAAGVRVVASDHLRRPSGVELFSLEKDDLFEVVVNGGRLSDGSGLGCSVDQGVAALKERLFSS